MMRSFTEHIQKISRITAYMLAGLCLLLLFLFLNKGLTYDELYSAASASHAFSFSTVWINILLQEINTPLYNVLLYGWSFFTPAYGEIWLRIPSLIFAFATLAVVWFSFPKTLNKLHRFIFFCLLCTNGDFMYYAREARCYSLLLLLSTVLLFLTVRLGQNTVHKEPVAFKRYIYFSLLGILACYTHYFGAALFFALLIILLGYRFYYKASLLPLLISGGLVFLAFLPWLYHIFTSQIQTAVETWWIKNTFAGLLNDLAFMFFQGWPLCFAVIAFCGIGGKVVYQKEGLAALLKPSMLIPLTAGLLVLLTAGIVSLKINVLYPRYFMVIVPCVFLLIAQLLGALIERDKGLIVMIPLLQILVLFPNTFDQFFAPQRGYNPTKRTIEFLSKSLGGDPFFLYLDDFHFPPKAVDAMLNYYVQPYGLSGQLSVLNNASLNRHFEQHNLAQIWIPVIHDRKIEKMRREYPLQILDVNPALQLVLAERRRDHE